ncbi:MAG: toll/interleukin-1 receptor domain-containing protein [Planctomycetota bacterium]|nr:toll/interleukin-1 receptor domain-containing protein [Planctomycetota bacterium]
MLFISHKTEDKAIANEMLRRTLEHGYSVKQIFLDSDPGSGIEAGASWERKIYESLKHTRAMIVLCSPNWLKSQWCFVELGYAKAMAIEVFPIIIEKCDVGSTLNTTQAIDLTTKEGACLIGAARDTALNRLWTALEEQHLGPKDNLPWPPPGEPDNCPFPGLMYFDEKHAPVFFGREQERDTVIKQLKAMRSCGVPRLLMIVGGSGSGKSSLLRAGVLPWLRHPTEQRDWLVLPTLRYGETPNDDVTLHARLAEVIADRYPQNHPRRPDWKELRDKFEADDVERAARDFVDATVDLCQAQRQDGSQRATASDQAPTTLLVIDQFEELLTAAARPSMQKFLRFLRTLLSRSNGRFLVIGTMRSDYLDTYEQHAESLKPPFLELYRLPPFPWERVTEVIVKPAGRVDVTFTEELITRLKGDAPNCDALPLLAFTLEKLFRQCASDDVIELREYEQLGGMTGAITQAVTHILPHDLAKKTEQDLRLSFVMHLAQVNERDEFVRRPARWSQIPDAAKPLLEQFVRERLLHRSGEAGELIEVSHEALFRSWDQLTKWLNESSRILLWRRDVEHDRKFRSRFLARPDPITTRCSPQVASRTRRRTFSRRNAVD